MLVEAVTIVSRLVALIATSMRCYGGSLQSPNGPDPHIAPKEGVDMGMPPVLYQHCPPLTNVVQN